MWNNKEYSIHIEKNSMLDFERIMLTSGECSFFMPMGFMVADDGETVCYDCSGFVPLSRYKIERTDDALYILENILLILRRAVEYLITPAKVTLNTDTVFYNKETGEVKIAYFPSQDKNGSLKKHLVSFIGQIKKDICDEYSRYLIEIAKCIYYYNYHINDIVNKVGLFRREIYIREQRNKKQA